MLLPADGRLSTQSSLTASRRAVADSLPVKRTFAS
jgi:hypothetical protein